VPVARSMHPWRFARRFRRGGFGWRSATAVDALREAIAEVAGAVRMDRALGAAGAVALLVRLSGAFANVDSSSGALGTAVNDAIATFAPIVGTAPLAPAQRHRLLDRLWQGVTDDDYGYLDGVEHHWGSYCGPQDVSAAWADERLAVVRTHLTGERSGYLKGTIATLSALSAASRYDDVLELLDGARTSWWHYREWGFEALLALGRRAEAFRYAEASRGVNDGPAVDAACERVLLGSGLQEEAYGRYGMSAAPYRSTNLAVFRAVCKKYPAIEPRRIVRDLAANDPGREGRWFAAAVSANCLDVALALAERSSADPHTLLRAARKQLEKEPSFACDVALLALRSIAAGWGFDVTSGDVTEAAAIGRDAATRLGRQNDFERRLNTEDIAGSALVRHTLRLQTPTQQPRRN